ncbi:hypothetical protein AB0M58_14335 [Streptomyces bobili]|uniref:hypothetical protein n=1 Tax=Streptomyces bobili TaxID=67280 RepID=UPI0034447B7A
MSLALDGWQRAWTAQLDAAQAALSAALPGLEQMKAPTGCCDLRLRVDRPGEVSGHVCFDDHARVTVDLTGIPQQALGRALDVFFGADWFDEGPDGIAGASAGTYGWDDDATYAEYEIRVQADGTAGLCMAYVKVHDAVAILDELQQKLRQDQQTPGPKCQ